MTAGPCDLRTGSAGGGRDLKVTLCHSLVGPLDLLVLVETGSLEQLASVRERVAALAGVAGVETAPVVGVHATR